MLAVNMRKAGVAKRSARENKMELKKTQKKWLMCIQVSSRFI